MTKRGKVISFRITAQMFEKLKQIAYRRGVTCTDLMRYIVQKFIEEEERKVTKPKDFLFNREEINKITDCLLTKEQLQDFLVNMNIVDVAVANDDEDFLGDGIFARCLWYAHTKYPDANLNDKITFASLVTYFVTGLDITCEYNNDKKKQAEQIIIKLIKVIYNNTDFI